MTDTQTNRQTNKSVLVFVNIIILIIKIWYTRMFGKNCVFLQFTATPPRLHRCQRPSKLSTQCECTVNPPGWYFFVHHITAECWRGRGDKLSIFFGKETQYLMNTLYVVLIFIELNYNIWSEDEVKEILCIIMITVFMILKYLSTI